MAKLSQTISQQLRTSLSAAQIQGIKMLALQTLQLEQKIEHEVEDNPALEKIENENEGNETETTIDDYINEENQDSDIRNYSRRTSPTDSKADLFSRIPTAGKTLEETLNDQLVYLDLTDKQTNIAKFLIGTLDGDGYLRRDNLTLSDDLIFTQGIDASEDEIEKVILAIQQLEPAGVAARTLQECLLIQLYRTDTKNDDIENAVKILRDYFDAFTNRHYDTIMSKIGITESQLRGAINEITALTPKPANGFSSEEYENALTITPDFFVEYDDESLRFKVSTYRDNIPQLKVSSSYQKMANELKRKNDRESKDAFQFIENKIKSAEWFISALKQRQETLEQTMKAIVDYQTEYFREGDQNLLRPMTLRDIAERTGYDISTIQRVVNSKYVQTSFGIFLLKDFFSGGYTTSTGDEVSTKSIKNILKNLIDNEDSLSPLTDQQLMDSLHSQGYEIARRTVAKYRESLGFPVARLRKKI